MRIAIIGQQDFGKAVLEAFLARKDEVAALRREVRIFVDLPGWVASKRAIPEFISGVWGWYRVLTAEEERFVTQAVFMHGIRAINYYMLAERDRWTGCPIGPRWASGPRSGWSASARRRTSSTSARCGSSSASVAPRATASPTSSPMRRA